MLFENKTLTVGMIYDVFEMGDGPTCAFNVYDEKGIDCIWRMTPILKHKMPPLTEEQRNMEVLRISTVASGLYLNVDTCKYNGPRIRNTGDYY